VGELVLPPETAEIERVCEPCASELNVTEPLVVPGHVFPVPSRVQVNVTPV
jgi:hypothetical protein